MATRKVAVSLPAVLLDDARRAVEAGAARSVSAHVADALRSFRHRQTLDELSGELDAAGPVPTEVQRWAEREIAGAAGDDIRAAG